METPVVGDSQTYNLQIVPNDPLTVPCLIDVQCSPCDATGCNIAAQILNDAIPQFVSNSSYGTQLEYKCGLGREFQGGFMGSNLPSIVMECQWEMEWDATLSKCVCKSLSIMLEILIKTYITFMLKGPVAYILLSHHQITIYSMTI